MIRTPPPLPTNLQKFGGKYFWTLFSHDLGQSIIKNFVYSKFVKKIVYKLRPVERMHTFIICTKTCSKDHDRCSHHDPRYGRSYPR